MVSQYYPIETDLSNESFEGYQKLLAITHVKINQVIDDDLPASFNKLINEVSKEFKDFKVFSEIYKQFPNYALRIELLNKDFEEVSVTYNLKLRLSLLTNFFTVFFEEVILHKNMSYGPTIYFPLTTNVLSSRLEFIENGKSDLNKLKAIVQEIFKEYGYISHISLFNTKILNGIPHGFLADPEVQYPLYSFLFDNDYSPIQPLIILP
ncbi:MAG: hypothetical protein EOO90_21355 [Pedobacter sp.]|nr:MAG: hypothetical protein EOO90_21355 [Pedobacter sp.]